MKKQKEKEKGKKKVQIKSGKNDTFVIEDFVFQRTD